MVNDQPSGLANDNDKPRSSAVDMALANVRRMIFEGRLLPGTPVRQGAVAEYLGISRVPVREALKVLEGDGILAYELNVGYRVAKLSASEIGQIYLMRRLLETELLTRLPQLSDSDIEEFENLNRKMSVANKLGDLPAFMQLNRQFHFAMFELARLPRIVSTLSGLWDAAAPYNAMYGSTSEMRTRVVHEHAGMIASLRQHNALDLITKMNDHRTASLLRQSGPEATAVATPEAEQAT